MSFESEYFALRKKWKEEELRAAAESALGTNSFSDEYLKLKAQSIASNEAKLDNEIAPVRTASGELTDYAKNLAKEKLKEKNKDDGGLDFFDSGAFSDGYDIGDVTKTILGTLGDVGVNAVKGVGNMVEGIADLAAYGTAEVAEMFGFDEGAKAVREKAKKNEVNDALQGAVDWLDDYSLLGRTTQGISEGVGQIGLILATGGAAGALGAGTAATSAITLGATGLSGAGSGMSEAYNSGATDEEAQIYGLISGASDVVTEMIFGGMGKGAKALGFSKGLSSADDIVAKGVSKAFNGQLGKTLAEVGVNAGAEGLEEVLAGGAQAIGKKLTYMSEEDFGKILADENLLEQFIVGSFTSGLAQGDDVRTSLKTGTDLVTGLTQNEQKVIDRVYKDTIAEREADGEKLSRKQKNEIYESVLSNMDKGYISTDIIEETLGGDTYKQLSELTEKEAKDLEEFASMYEGDDLTNRVEEYLANSKKGDLKTQLSDEVKSLVAGSRLAESYNEKIRGGQQFQIDLEAVDQKQRATYQRAIESGVLNNTNRTRELVSLVAKLEADGKGTYNFSDNAKLAESGFSVEGKTINVIKGADNNITINVQSKKYLNSVVGHEITHVLEGSELYGELQSAVFEYAKSRGEYESRLKALDELYKTVEGYKGADGMEKIRAELTADLVGDYLFQDADFINHLSTKNRNVFEKIYDEIKYLCKVVTAGSKEARQLERAKKAFEDVYREGSVTVAFDSNQTKSVANENPTGDKDIRYSLSGQNTAPKKYGNLAISGEDVRFGPVAESAQTSAENVQKPDADALFEERKALRSVKNRTEEQNRRLAELKEQNEAIKPKPKKRPKTDNKLIRVKDDSSPIAPGMEERSWYETSSKSEAVDGAVKPEDIPDELRYYQVKGNKQTLDTANTRLNNMGYEKSVTYFEGKLTEKKVTVEDIALGERLIQEAVKRGDTKTATDLIVDISILGTELGQQVQALSIIKKLSPEGQLQALHKLVKRGKAKGDKAFDGVEVTEDMAKQILETRKKDGTYDQKKLNRVVEDAKQQIANQMHVSFMEKANAWRYFSMLGNPKTHARNIVSNVANFATRTVKNVVARTVEDVALRNAAEKSQVVTPKQPTVIPNGTVVRAKDRGNYGTVTAYDAATKKYSVSFTRKSGRSATVQFDGNQIEPRTPVRGKGGSENLGPVNVRTKTWKRSSDDVKAYAKQVTAEMKDVIAGNAKYSDTSEIKQMRQIFKTKVLDKATNFNTNAMEKEDAWFSRPTFERAFAEYLTANGIVTEQDIQNNPELVEKAKAYALDEAKAATFRQDSYIANKIGEIERKNAAFGLVIGSVMPFKKTPINVAKTGVAYSPLGIARGLYDLAQVRKGNTDMTTAIDHLAQGLTGTSLALLGYALASMGILNGAGEDDKEGKYDYQLGKQAYSVTIGGNTYSLSWLSPAAMPLFVGANFYEGLVEGEEWDFDMVTEALGQTLDPMSEMSFLSSLDDVLSSYDDGMARVWGAGESLLQNYVTQYVPTLSSQLASTMDDTKRSTKPSRDSGATFLEETWNKIRYKAPGLRNTLEPMTDIWGNEVAQNQNPLTNFLAPWNEKEGIATEVDEELKELYRETGKTELLPSIPYNYTNYGGEKYEMSAEEHTAYKKIYGQTANDLMAQLFETDTYKNGDAELRVQMVRRVYDYARDEANKAFFSGRDIDFTNAEVDGTPVYRADAIKEAIENDMTLDAYAMYSENPSKYNFLERSGITFDAYNAADENGKRAYTWAFDNQGKYEVSKAISDDYLTFYGYKDTMNDFDAKDESGETVSGLKKERTIDYINGLDLDYGQKILLFKMQYKTDNTYNMDIINYLNDRDDISRSEMETILKELGFTVRADGYITWD